jgi:hypothetical protein
MLLRSDPRIVNVLHESVRRLLSETEMNVAVQAAVLTLAYSRDARGELVTLADEFPALKGDEWFAEAATQVREQGFLSLE